MIGNDIVDLAHAKQESNWRRRGFLTKVFTDHEQQLIYTANDPDRMVWLLWSMKESVYKLITRQSGMRVFAPQKLVCHIKTSCSETAEGSVFHEIMYQTKSLITNQYVATVAYSADVLQPVNQIIIPFKNATYQTQHTAIREIIKYQCASYLSIPEMSIHIHKNETGVPTLSINNTLGTTVGFSLSISHHGHYGAYIIELPPIEMTVE